MSRVRNASEFRDRLRQARRQYARIYKPTIDRLRMSYKQQSPTGEIDPDTDECLEVHERHYFLDVLLALLTGKFEVELADSFRMSFPNSRSGRCSPAGCAAWIISVSKETQIAPFSL